MRRDYNMFMSLRKWKKEINSVVPCLYEFKGEKMEAEEI